MNWASTGSLAVAATQWVIIRAKGPLMVLISSEEGKGLGFLPSVLNRGESFQLVRWVKGLVNG